MEGLTRMSGEISYEEHVFSEEPFYVPVGDEVETFRAAYRATAWPGE